MNKYVINQVFFNQFTFIHNVIIADVIWTIHPLLPFNNYCLTDGTRGGIYRYFPPSITSSSSYLISVDTIIQLDKLKPSILKSLQWK